MLVLKIELLCTVDVGVFAEPLFVTIKLGGRSECPVGHHGEQRTLDVEPEPPLANNLVDHLVDAKAAPEVLQHVEIAVAVGLNELPGRVVGDNLLGGTAPQGAVRQATQPLGGLAIFGRSCR